MSPGAIRKALVIRTSHVNFEGVVERFLFTRGVEEAHLLLPPGTGPGAAPPGIGRVMALRRLSPFRPWEIMGELRRLRRNRYDAVAICYPRTGVALFAMGIRPGAVYVLDGSLKVWRLNPLGARFLGQLAFTALRPLLGPLTRSLTGVIARLNRPAGAE